MTEFKLNLDDEEPVKQPAVAELQSEPSKPHIGLVALMCLTCFLLGFNVNRLINEHRSDDGRETVEPVDPSPKPDERRSSVDLKSITLVVIHDKDVTNDTKEYAASLADDRFADWCKANIKDLEVLTTEDEIAKQVFAGGNFKAPVVIAYTGKKYLWDMPLPKGGMEPIRKKLEGK